MIRQLPIHTIFFSVFPVLFLFSQNYHWFQLSLIVVPLILSTAGGLALWYLVNLLLVNFKQSALVTSLLVLAFYSFGPTYDLHHLVIHLSPFGIGAVIYALVLLFGIIFFFRSKQHVSEWTFLFNVAAAFLIMTSCVPLLRGLYATAKAQTLLRTHDETYRLPPSIKGSAIAPDIYYVVLDGYRREDVLKDVFKYDNSKFISFLTDRGFFVARSSSANYCQTTLSLASSLNFSYLDVLLGYDIGKTDDLRLVAEKISKNRVTQFLRAMGYSIIEFSSEYNYIDISQPDVEVGEWWYPSLFSITVLDSTPFSLMATKFGWGAHDVHRGRILQTLKDLDTIARLPGPKFVFIHIFAPHPPFVFGANGEVRNPGRRFRWADGDEAFGRNGAAVYRKGYTEQVSFLNKKIQIAIDAILRQSSRQPLIILQGDHGSRSRLNVGSLEKTDVREAFSILNAYLLPAGGPEVLYDAITPVNSFRVLFNRYFGTDYPLLEDQSYYSTWDRPYEFVEVTAGLGSGN